MLYGGGTGFCHVMYGADPCRNDNGKMVRRVWSETRERYAFAYPAQANAAIAKIAELSARGLDVYVATSLMRTDAWRSKVQVASLWCLHADLDNGVISPAYEHLWCAVSTETSGHHHVYVPLSEPVTGAEFEALQDALVRLPHVKTCGNDVLRPPWTPNFKPTVDHDEPTQVWWVMRRTMRINPRELAQFLGVDLDNCKTGSATASANGQQPYDGGPINLALDPKVL